MYQVYTFQNPFPLYEITGCISFDALIDRVDIYEWENYDESRLDALYQGNMVTSILFAPKTIWVWREIRLE